MQDGADLASWLRTSPHFFLSCILCSDGMENSMKIALQMIGIFTLIFGIGWLRAKITGHTDMDVLLGDSKPQSIFSETGKKNSD
jgi:hypothetical protein